nr:hypothetical protein [Pseudobdellovibrionaceae bacterium]
KKSRGFSQEPLPFPIPLPPEIWGIRFDTQKIEIDYNGFLVLYLNYAQKSSKEIPRKGAGLCSN